MDMNRRQFAFSAGAFAIGAAAPFGAHADGGSGSYTVPILGDTHFDETEWGTYHVGWTPRDARDAGGRRSEFARDAAMWKERLPALLAAAGECARPTDAFLLQVGDLVQGDCATPEMQLRFYKDAVAACRRGFGSLPFVTVPGNHDVRNGGRPVYDSFFPALHSKELGRRIDSTNFAFRHGPDAWIFTDFIKHDAESTFAALDAARDARHVFIVCHSPLTPTDGWGFFWILFGKKEDTGLRREFRRRMMEMDAIVLCGHTHVIEVDEWRNSDGHMIQFTANSVWRTPDEAELHTITDDPASWGKLWVEKNASDRPEEHDGNYTNRTREESLALMAEYAPGLVRYEKYRAAGHCRLNVSDKSVYVDFYGGAAHTPTRRFVLRG